MSFQESKFRSWFPYILGGIATIIVYGVLVIYGILPLNPFTWLLDVGDQVRSQLPAFGPLAPLAYIALYAAQIIIAPLPGQGLAFTAGFLFGSFWAPIYSMVGILVGGIIAFIGARRIGWPLVERMAPKSWLDRWRNLAAVNSEFTWFLLMLAPTADVFYFIAGLTTLRLRRFILIMLLGRTPGIVLSSFIGANVESFGAQWMFVLIAALLLIAWLGNVLRQRIEQRALVSSQQNLEGE